MQTKTFQLAILFILFTQLSTAQNYLDLARLNIARTSMEDVEETLETDITNINLEFLYPTPISESTILITGFTAESTSLELFSGADSESLIMTRLNLGAKVSHSKTWTGTYLLLPKIASNFEDVGGMDFQMGAIALLEYRHKNRFRTKYGLYSSSEEFGAIITPLLGVYYRTANSKFLYRRCFPYSYGSRLQLERSF